MLWHAVKIQEMTVYFCETVAKPHSILLVMLSFCSGDSLELTVTKDGNKGYTLKWYYGSNQDITNTSSKSIYIKILKYLLQEQIVWKIVMQNQIIKLQFNYEMICHYAPTISSDTAR